MTAIIYRDQHPTFTEVEEEYVWGAFGPISGGRWASYDEYEAFCVRCGTVVGFTVDVCDETGHDRVRTITIWEDPLMQPYCEDCVIDVEDAAR